MTSTPNYVVHTYHVNINTGDGQIVLLVDDSTKSTTKRGTIAAASLLDGGKGSDGTQMVKVINEINLKYDFDASKGFGGTLKFDSVIISHWDVDHYQGVFGVLKTGFLKSINEANVKYNTDHPTAKVAKNTIPASNATAVAGVPPRVPPGKGGDDEDDDNPPAATVKKAPKAKRVPKGATSAGPTTTTSLAVPTSTTTSLPDLPKTYEAKIYQNAFLKYTTASDGSWTCNSTMYSPYWNAHFDPSMAAKKATGKRSRKGTLASVHGAAWSSLTSLTVKYKVAGELLKVTGDAPYVPLDLDTNNAKPSERTGDLSMRVAVQGSGNELETVRFIKFAKLVSHRYELIGVNFFTNRMPTSGTPRGWRTLKDTKALVAAHDTPAVGLYCIGVDGEVIDSTIAIDGNEPKKFKATGAVLAPVGQPTQLLVPITPVIPLQPMVVDGGNNGNSSLGQNKVVIPNHGVSFTRPQPQPLVTHGMPKSTTGDGKNPIPLLARGGFATPSSTTVSNDAKTSTTLDRTTSDEAHLTVGRRPGFHPVIRVVDENSSTGTNRSSIIAVVVFNDGRTQEYLAGDADYPVEIAAANWLNQRVPLVKLSHHGASHSTPLPLINILNPDKIMCSAGDTKGYAHPRWETVLFFALREKIRQKMWSPFALPSDITPVVTKQPVFQKPFYNTMYPIWMSTESKYSIDTFEEIKNINTALSPTAIFVKVLLGMWRLLNVADGDTLYEGVKRARATILGAEYAKLPPTRPRPIVKHRKPRKGTLSVSQEADNAWLKALEEQERKEARTRITANLLEEWKSISYIDHKFGQPGSKKTSGASSAILSVNDSILYFLAKLSKPGSTFDPSPGPDLNIVLPRNSAPNENIGVDLTAWSETGEIELFPPGTHVIAVDPLVDLAPVDTTNTMMQGSDLTVTSSSDPQQPDFWLSFLATNPWADYINFDEPEGTPHPSNNLPPADTGLLTPVPEVTMQNNTDAEEEPDFTFGLLRNEYWYNSDMHITDFTEINEIKVNLGLLEGEDMVNSDMYAGIDMVDVPPPVVPLTALAWNNAVSTWCDNIVDGDPFVMDDTGNNQSDLFFSDDSANEMHLVDREVAPSVGTAPPSSHSTLVIREVAASNNNSPAPGPFPATFSTKMASTTNVPGSIQSLPTDRGIIAKLSTNNPAPIVRAAATPSVVFYMSSKRFPVSVESASQVRLQADSMPDNFVTRLEKGFIAAKSALTGDTVGVDLADNDKLALRIGYNGLGGVLSVYGTGKSITAFSLKAALSVAGEIPSPPWDLVFDSRSLNGVFGRPEIGSAAPPPSTTTPATGGTATVLSLDSHGILPPASTLVLGLKTVGFQTKLTRVLTTFHFPYSQLLGLDSSIDLDLTVENANSRNAVWIYSNLKYTSVIRLQMHVDENQIQHITNLLNDLSSSISLVGVKVVVVRTSNCNTTGSQTSVIMEPSLSIAATVSFTEGFQFTGTLVFSPALLRLVLTNDKSFTIEAMGDWLSTLLGVPNSFWNWIPGLNEIILKQITVSLQGDRLTKGNFKIDFEIALNFGKAGKKVVFMLSFSGPPFRFSGMMWTKFSLDNLLPEARALDPLWEPYMTLLPTSGGLSPPYTELADSVSLLELIPGVTITAQPKWLPVDLAAVSLQVDENAMQFSGTLVCPAPTEGDIPPIKFDILSLTAWYDRTTTKGDPANFWITLSGGVIITPMDNTFASAEIDATVKYSSATSEWMIEGSVRDLNLGMLWSFFDANDRGLMADILNGITVKYLDIVYEFHTGAGRDASLPSSLFINGTITLGSIELILQYQHLGKNPATGQSDWSLHASLGSTSGTVETIGSIADSILGDSVADILPHFIADVQINLGAGGGPDDAPLQLDVEKGGNVMVLSVRVQLTQSISITFVQATKETPADAATKVLPKRIIRFTLDGFPTVSGIPLLNSLPQPFDEMHYVWVQDNNTDPTNKNFVAGLTQEEIDSINWVLPDADQIPYKATAKPPQAGTAAGGTTSPVVLRAGHHFMVMSSGVVSLDYLFDPTKPAAPATTLHMVRPSGMVMRDVLPPSTAATEPADNHVAMGTMQKSIGPLSIANVGLQYKGGILWLFLDATVHLGPIEFALLGFGIGLDLSGVTLDNLAGFFEKLPGAIHLQINGMGLGFNQPPVVAVGVFMKAVDRTAYMGGVALSFIPYTFLAVGAYEEKDKPGGGSYKSVFVFAKLDGPLITLEFAEINGVKIGFGYNSQIRFPQVSEVMSFPFISDAAVDTKPDPISVLQTIQAGNWVTPQENQLWLAAGLKVLAFEAVSISAVACITFGASSLALGIFADAVARMPTGAPIDACFINVELGILVYIDFLGGIFRAEAQLSPNSFVICPDCHLTGGFALCYWFPGSDHVGDWVFTIGGYHRSFDVPDHYPTPPRLGISWRLDDCLSISGEAYFAITPKACMGGGRLEVVFSCGPINASLAAYADFLINFKPFHFFGDVGVSVSVSFNIDVGLIHISIGGDISADVHLEGPPFGGIAHVDFYVCGFDIRFGPQPGAAPILSLEDFWTFVKETGPKTAPAATDTADPAQSMLLFNLEDGAVADAAKPKSVPGDPWVVRAGNFQFRVSTPFALSLAHCNAADMDNPVPFYAKPMHVTQGVVSELTVTITANTDVNRVHKFRPTKLMKDVPAAAWDKYNPDEDPSSKPADSLLSPAGGTSSQLMGLIIAHPYPILSADTIPAFNAHDAMNEDIFPGDNPLLPARPPTQAAWLPTMPVNSNLADYQNVASAWGAAPLQGLVGDLVVAWTDLLDWDLSAPEDAVLKTPVAGQSKAAPRTSLNTGPPGDILLKDFEAYYVGCPGVAVSG